MNNFDFYSPTKILFGLDRESETGEQIAAFGGSRVLVVYGGKSAEKSGLIKRIEDSLSNAGLEYKLLGGVQPNPRLKLVREGIEISKKFNADFLLGVGGGSAIDTAKAIAVGAANPDTDIWDIWTRKASFDKVLPIGAVLTISAAGSELSDSAVLTDWDTKTKRGLNSDMIRPKIAIMNPLLTSTLPKYQLTCGIVDIMMHTMDRYFNPVTDNELTDALAEALLRTTIKCGLELMKNPSDIHCLSEIMWAGSLSHNNLTGLGGTKDFTTHQLGHELSGKFDVAHGASLSTMWPSFARYAVDANPARFGQFGRNVLGLDDSGKAEKDFALESIQATEDFFRKLDMPTCFSELGIGVLSEEELDDLADRCVWHGKRTVGFFKVLDKDDVTAIYKMANH